MPDETFTPKSGKMFDSNGNIVNIADLLQNIINRLQETGVIQDGLAKEEKQDDSISIQTTTNGNISNISTLLGETQDRVTQGIRQIDTDHAYIHDSKLFECFFKFTLATTATRYISIKTPEVLYIHYRKEKVVSSADKVTIEFFENAVLDAVPGGTLFTPVNHNRINGNASTVEVRDAPTVTTEGTKIFQSFIGGGTGQGQARTGDDLGQKSEIVLKRNAIYLIKIINSSSTDNIIQCNPTWYEEADV